MYIYLVHTIHTHVFCVYKYTYILHALHTHSHTCMHMYVCIYEYVYACILHIYVHVYECVTHLYA